MIKGMVSTIIPVYNRPELLQEAVASVLAQRYKPIEIIVVDDGSDDPAMARALDTCVGPLSSDAVRVLRQENRGPGAARQAGLQEARGEFVQFLDSDDLLLPDKFRLQVQILHAAPHAGIAYGKTSYRTRDGTLIAPWRRTGEEFATLIPSMLIERWWGTSTPLYRRSVIKQAGPISSLRNEEDWEFDCRLGAAGVRLAWVDEWVSEQRDAAPERASAKGSSDPEKLRDRARARHLILKSALKAGVPKDTSEFQAFISYSFLVARQCASAGLPREAEDLVEALNAVSPRSLMRLYLLAGRCLGYARATRIAERAHRVLRSGKLSP